MKDLAADLRRQAQTLFLFGRPGQTKLYSLSRIKEFCPKGMTIFTLPGRQSKYSACPVKFRRTIYLGRLSVYPACPVCPIGPEDRIGVAPADGTGVKLLLLYLSETRPQSRNIEYQRTHLLRS